MSREIKLRVWDEDSMVMRDQGEYSTVTVDCFFNSDLILMQYTGRKDKNGVEIYEGDITNAGVISCRKGTFTTENIKTYNPVYGRSKNYIALHNYGSNKQIEVIGNIYENPELIGDKDD